MKLFEKKKGVMKRNVKLMVFLELVLLVIVIMLVGNVGGKSFFNDILYRLIDLPTIFGILILTIPSLIFMGEWKNFLRAFSVGKKKYTLLELKNINGAVSACQKLIFYAGVMEFVFMIIIVLGCLDTPETIGVNISVAVLTVFYSALFECLLIPVKVNAERVMNEEIDIDVKE